LEGTDKNLQNENITTSLQSFYNQAIINDSVSSISLINNWDKNGNRVLDVYYTGTGFGSEFNSLDTTALNHSVMYVHGFRKVWRIVPGSYPDSIPVDTIIDSTPIIGKKGVISGYDTIPPDSIFEGIDSTTDDPIWEIIPGEINPVYDSIPDTTGYNINKNIIFKDTTMNRLPKAGDKILYLEKFFVSRGFEIFPTGAVDLGVDHNSNSNGEIAVSKTGWWQDSVPYISLENSLSSFGNDNDPIVFSDLAIGLSDTTETGSTTLMDGSVDFYRTMAHELLHRHAALQDVDDLQNIMHYKDNANLNVERLLYYHEISGVETGTSIANGIYENQWNKIHGAAK
jgi:hypothetical protein